MPWQISASLTPVPLSQTTTLRLAASRPLVPMVMAAKASSNSCHHIVRMATQMV